MRVDEPLLIHESPPSDPMRYLFEQRKTRLVSDDILLSFGRGTARFSPDGDPHVRRSGGIGGTW